MFTFAWGTWKTSDFIERRSMELSQVSRQVLALRQQLRASFVLLFGCLAIAHNIAISAVTVEQAYRSIPHRYTPFESKGVRMSQQEATFLSEFFRLVNLAIVARVQAQAGLQSNGKKGSTVQNYQRTTDALLVQLESQAVPDSLKAMLRAVIDAIKDQKAYFD